eukprot:CAMPEP_0115005222 /NCGR_PEP_ID=MMETSP0216-20121206/19726_1 /TAXON_ID=223996 /ORGANISM="Protocruzia adherens, Strain Boccale" /LENGTH=636 /DNA_ID=CAMNT_0002371473 /DNA_START=46 /DNA_END=1956 /DNA_ORIENTATION=-
MGKFSPNTWLIVPFLLLCWSSVAKKSLEDFDQRPFETSESEGLYEVELNINNEEGNIMKLFADYNEDDHTDIVTVNDNKNVVSFYIWDEDEWVFSERTSMAIDFSHGTIVNLSASDFDDDDTLDLFVVYQAGTNEPYQFAIYLQNYSNGVRSFPNTPIFSGDVKATSQPVLIDVNGDMLMDILFYDGGRKVWQNPGKGNTNFIKKDFSDFSAEGCMSSNSEFANPHSIALNDFNGDCKSDLFVNSVSDDGKEEWFEYWIFDRGQYCLSCKLALPSDYVNNHGVVTFADFDDNAIIDMAFPVFGDSPGIAISYNWHDVDRDEDHLCLNRDDFVIGMNSAQCTRGSSDTKSSSKGAFVFTKLAMGSFFNTGENPSMVRIGDFNLDGYPDGLVILQTEKNVRVNFLKSRSCDDVDCGAGDTDDRRGLTVSNDGTVEEINGYTGSISTAFFDLANLGSVDILINFRSEGISKIVGYYNNWYDDSFYLRAQGVNGDTDNSEGYYGMNFKMVATDVDAHDYMKNGIQLSQSGYTALQTPYIMFGVGRTNNYFTKFNAAAPINSDDYDHEWTPIIPKSQLIIYADGLDASDWTLETILNPTEQAFIIMLCSLSALFILGIVILCLHKVEKGENQAKQKLFYNF